MSSRQYRSRRITGVVFIFIGFICTVSVYPSAAYSDVERIYQAQFQRTYDATAHSLETMRANVKNLNPNSIDAFIPATAWWSAAILTLHIEPVSENETRVRVDPSSTTVLRNFPASWLNDLFAKIEQSLKIKNL
jgi:hypothetical protein